MYARKLKELKWFLKVNSEAGASFMKQALALINQSVRIVNQVGDTSSTTTSPASNEFKSTGQGSRTPEQHHAHPIAQQWMQLQQHAMQNGQVPYNAYHDYSLDQAAFSDPETMFGGFPDQLDGTWMHDPR